MKAITGIHPDFSGQQHKTSVAKYTWLNSAFPEPSLLYFRCSEEPYTVWGSSYNTSWGVAVSSVVINFEADGINNHHGGYDLRQAMTWENNELNFNRSQINQLTSHPRLGWSQQRQGQLEM